MDLNDLLSSRSIDPRQVLVLRHRPMERQFNKVLPWLASERHDLYNAYQRTQGEKLERVMLKAMHVASFIGHEPAKAAFVGIYDIGSATHLTFDDYWSVPEHQELSRFGMWGIRKEDPRTSVLRFNLALTDAYSHWKGKLVVSWPPPERSWWRRAHRNSFSVIAIHEESLFSAAMPSWDEINLSWNELAILPSRWREALSHWRGIYFIFDRSDGRGYVGSAYGGSNLLGRWKNYAASGHGGNRLLLGRDQTNFRFTILQRVSPDMDSEEVIRLEGTWKDRLHTRQPFGLNDN